MNFQMKVLLPIINRVRSHLHSIVIAVVVARNDGYRKNFVFGNEIGQTFVAYVRGGFHRERMVIIGRYDDLFCNVDN